MTDKLQQANLLKNEIEAAEKELKLYEQIIQGFAKENALPKIGMQVNPKYPGNVVWFQTRYMTPTTSGEFIDRYMSGVRKFKEAKEKELETLLK